MPTKYVLSSDLPSLIAAIVAGRPTRRQLNEIVTLCHGLAATFLRRKIAGAMLQTRFHYASYRDLAYDCIAELFLQDDDGVPKVLRTYFNGLNVQELDEAEILIHLRRLIVARVNQELFRIFGEIDPSLTKVLRNMKLTLHELHTFTVITRFGEPCLLPAVTDRNDHLPVVDAMVLERELSKETSGLDEIPALLSVLAKYLREQTSYSRMVPLMTAARVFRSLITRNEETNDVAEMEDRFMVPDTLNVVRKTCRHVKREMAQKYTGSKKVAEEVFHQYWTVVEEAMIHRFTGDDPSDRTLFETFRLIKPDLTRVEYYRKHRSVVEYLARVTHRRIAERLRAEM
jgi:hypothetical protein